MDPIKLDIINGGVGDKAEAPHLVTKVQFWRYYLTLSEIRDPTDIDLHPSIRTFLAHCLVIAKDDVLFTRDMNAELMSLGYTDKSISKYKKSLEEKRWLQPVEDHRGLLTRKTQQAYKFEKNIDGLRLFVNSNWKTGSSRDLCFPFTFRVTDAS